MNEIYALLKSALTICQCIAALTGVFYFFRLKNSYWKWFSVYLVIIFVQQLFWGNCSSYLQEHYRIPYYTFFGVPLQFIFLYWLYAQKSLKKKKLFWFCVFTYTLTIVILTFYKVVDEIFSISTNISTFLLLILVIMEFTKQIKSDNILEFKKNKMFYVNLGVILFYIGNYPFHILGPELYINHNTIWNIYYVYFLTTNCLMYLLFSASILWGKTR